MNYIAERASLVAKLSAEIQDWRVLYAMTRIPRENFVPADEQHLAYEDEPRSIGFKQTISQPYIVALMTEALDLAGNEKVLEVGTGSGYQAAVLAQLSQQVITVERIANLTIKARETLQKLGYTNISVCQAEETLGWQKEQPYDAILVTGSVPSVPEELLAQLLMGGRLVVPVGSYYEQELVKVTKSVGHNIIKSLGTCRFVPIIGKGAWKN